MISPWIKDAANTKTLVKT